MGVGPARFSPFNRPGRACSEVPWRSTDLEGGPGNKEMDAVEGNGTGGRGAMRRASLRDADNAPRCSRETLARYCRGADMFTEADPFKPSRVSTRKRRSATLRSVLLAVFCIALAAACDPIYTRGLAVTHGPAPATGREYGEIAALVSELATRHGLRPYTATPFDGEKGMECY